MGTWISHLRIAENLLAVLPGLDEAAFTCGNLAPDSGIPNADWTEFDPPKTVTHYLNSGEGEDRIRDLEFYRAHLAGLEPSGDPARYSFVLGYFFHLLCDHLWSRRIVATSRVAYAEVLDGRGSAGWEILKGDWYGLDQVYARDHPESLFWRVLMRAPNPAPRLPFISAAALHQQLDYIRKYYSQPDPSWVLDRPYPYLNEAAMARYVADSTAALLALHARLQAGPPPVGAASALSLLPAEAVAPYPPPLGDVVP